ncbi:TRAP transporter large permease subunit [Pseudooceanicola spongiae]|uniref:TRAP transporter large permease subunit n=1 Tax=Pseudooceanicola spongiae TaxID=2613965 RepID=A0A7L9WI44_9RHOB|nr:TRAP transporter large permease subunit [Pseudooceanicola spongiae]QOL79909.1 TRAP transporter large permease subunit [Pseudooceanicola spongiae]
MTLYLVALLVFMIVGVPIAFSLGLAPVAYLLINDQWRLMIGLPQKMIAGIDSFVLLTMPFFILAGNLMDSENLTRQVLRFAQMLVGRVKGGLAVVKGVSSMMFSGVSGAATAEASAIGAVMIPALFLPVIIVGGIRLVVFTPTEAVVALCARLIGTLLYRTLSGSSIAQAFFDTATMTAGVMLIVAMASMSAFILRIENIPRAIAIGMRSISAQPWIMTLLLNLVLLVLGLSLEPLAALVLAMPILNEVFALLEIKAVQFGVLVVQNLMIGMITPLVGLCLFIVAAISKQRLEKVAHAILPMIGICLIVLVLIAFVPFLSLPAFFRA